MTESCQNIAEGVAWDGSTPPLPPPDVQSVPRKIGRRVVADVALSEGVGHNLGAQPTAPAIPEAKNTSNPASTFTPSWSGGWS